MKNRTIAMKNNLRSDGTISEQSKVDKPGALLIGNKVK